LRTAQIVALGAFVLSVAAGAAATTIPTSPSAACDNALAHQHTFHPKLLRTAPPPALTSILGVLRRPASRGDVLPRGGTPKTEYRVLWIKYVRLLASGSGPKRYFLIPGIWVDPLPLACRTTLSAQAQRSEARNDREQRSGSVSVEAFTSSGGEGPIALTKQEIERGTVLPDISAKSIGLYGIVPDGVAAVTVSEGSGQPASAKVRGNFFRVKLPDTASTTTQALTVRWHAASGRVLKTFPVTFASLTGSSF
jgi:hypothetical protein